MKNITPVVLLVEGQGHVPSFKNKKRAILNRASGKMRTLTDPETQRWMRKCEDSFVSQLHSWYRTNVIETQTEPCQPCLIASFMPSDDSVNHIREINVMVRDVVKGEEGAILMIECLNKEVSG